MSLPQLYDALVYFQNTFRENFEGVDHLMTDEPNHDKAYGELEDGPEKEKYHVETIFFECFFKLSYNSHNFFVWEEQIVLVLTCF